MQDGDDRCYLTKYKAYFQQKEQNITPMETEIIIQLLIEHLENYVGDCEVLTRDEAIEGSENLSIDSLTLSTSAAWPFTEFKIDGTATNVKNKGNFYLQEEGLKLVDEQYNNWREDEVVISFPMAGQSKSELRPAGKEKKPRFFVAVDAPTTINVKRLNADFDKQLSSNRGRTSFINSGFTPFARGYDTLYKKHDKFMHHIAGDIEGFDTSQKAAFCHILYRVRSHFYQNHPDYDRIDHSLRNMYSHFAQAGVLALDGTETYEHFCEMISGWWSTLTDNSMVRVMVTLLALVRTLGRIPNMKEFTMSTMGDDDIFSYNFDLDVDEFTNAMRSFGYVYTSSDKSGKVVSQPLKDIEFIKMGFFLPEGHNTWIFKFPRNRIISFLQYYNKKEFCTLESRVNAALLLSYGQPLNKEIRDYIRFLVGKGRLNPGRLHTASGLARIIYSYENIPGGPNTLNQDKSLYILQCFKMNTSVQNPINNDVMNSLMQDTPIQAHAPVKNASVSMIEKCTHPPKAVPGFCGLPTNDARSQVVVEYKNTKINTTPYIFDYGTALVRPVVAADLGTFDYALLVTNGGRVLSIPFVYNSTTSNLQQDYNNVDVQDNYDFTKFSTDATLYRPAYKSITTNLNATMFNDTGLVAGCQFNPNVLFAGTLLSMAHEEPKLLVEYAKLHHGKRNIHVPWNHADIDKHTKNHSSFPSYIMADLVSKLGLPKDAIVDLDPNTSAQVVSFGKVNTSGSQPSFVPSPSQILTLSTRSASWPAKEGTFGTSRLNTITPAWLAASNTSVAGNQLYECYVFYLDSANSPHFVGLGDNKAPGPIGTTPLYDTQWSKDMTWQWHFYQGLSLNSQASTSFQLLIKKYYTGYEVQPAFTSAWAGMVKLAPKPDLTAMQAMMDIFYDQKDIMPAKYNFLGSLVKLAGPLIKQLGGAEGIIGKGTELLTSMFSGGSAAKAEPPVKAKSVEKVSRREDALEEQIRVLTRKIEQMRMPSKSATKPAAGLPRKRLGTKSLVTAFKRGGK